MHVKNGYEYFYFSCIWMCQLFYSCFIQISIVVFYCLFQIVQFQFIISLNIVDVPFCFIKSVLCQFNFDYIVLGCAWALNSVIKSSLILRLGLFYQQTRYCSTHWLQLPTEIVLIYKSSFHFHLPKLTQEIHYNNFFVLTELCPI